MASAPPANLTEDPKAPPPPVNPNYRPQNPYQQRNYSQAQQAPPYYQGGYPQPPNVTVLEQPFMDPYLITQPREIIVMEDPYRQQYGQSRWEERQFLQPGPGNVVYVEEDPYRRRNNDDMWDDCLLGTCCASLLCCCLLR